MPFTTRAVCYISFSTIYYAFCVWLKYAKVDPLFRELLLNEWVADEIA